MDRAGGYRDWRALTAPWGDPRDLEDVLLAMQGEAEAQRIQEMRLRSQQRLK